jgi:hypothetical protein
MRIQATQHLHIAPCISLFFGVSAIQCFKHHSFAVAGQPHQADQKWRLSLVAVGALEIDLLFQELNFFVAIRGIQPVAVAVIWS